MPSYNEAQKRAVAHMDGPMMVLAGPGSGKTHVITGRTCNLIQSGVLASQILVVTFTKAAARQMKERFLRLMRMRSSAVTFGTFHGVFYGILKKAYRLRPDTIIGDDVRRRLIRELLLSVSAEQADEEDLADLVGAEISKVKDSRIDVEHFYSACLPEESFRGLYASYQEYLHTEKKMDFDDIMLYTWRLFVRYPDILSAWRGKFRYILIDEFQDINQIQYDIIKLLAHPADNLFVVGDDDQSIYRFRGANPQFILNFDRDFPGAGRVILDTNYRSTQPIIAAANRLIRGNHVRFEKHARPVRAGEAAVEIRAFDTDKAENEALARHLLSDIRAGVHAAGICVLFRTNTGSRRTVETMMEYNLPFRVRDNLPSIYQHYIAKDIIAYLKLGEGARDRTYFLRIANRPNRYLRRDSFDEREIAFEALYDRYADKNWMVERIGKFEHDLRVIGDLTPLGAINYIRHVIGYEDYLKQYAEDRRISAEELFEVLDEITDASKGFDTAEAWFDHIRAYEEKLKTTNAEQNPDAVTLSTLHGVKGLEYDSVYIMDVNETIIPHKKALLDADIEEERRLLYVGMTRARQALHLFWTKEKREKSMQPSRFLAEIGQEQSAESQADHKQA